MLPASLDSCSHNSCLPEVSLLRGYVGQKVYGRSLLDLENAPLRKTKSLAVLLKVAAIALTQGRNRCVLVQP
ncbi:hypothetical protein D9M71_530690 [compost metagenome]